MNCHKVSKALIILANSIAFGLGTTAWAAGDMLTPNEVQTTGISANPANDSGFFFSGGLKLGQARSTDGGATPGMASFGYLEPGFQVNSGSWSRLEFSAEVFGGSLDFRLPSSGLLPGKSELTGLTGLVAKVGHGYSLGGRTFGVVKAGLGMASGVYNVNYGTSTAKSDRTSGLVWTLGWQLIAPISQSFDFTAGLSWSQFQFNIDTINAAGTSVAIDRQLLANVPGADVGLRLRF